MIRLRWLAMILVSVLALALPLAATVTFSPAQPGIGQTVTFILNPAQPNFDRSYMINWNFGDGAGLETTILVLTASHAYANSGAFQVSVTYHFIDPAGVSQQITEQTTVQVQTPNRMVVFSPAQPNVGESVTFQAQNFLTPTTVDWDFGDGVTINDGGAVQTHAFNAAGTFLVQARDQGGSTAPTTVSVPVTNKRQIQFSPAAPKTGQAVQFQAMQFTTACIKWSFGDGTILAQGAAAASHVFAKPGVFQVTAQDNCGNSPWSAVTAVSISPSQGPLAGFDVSYGVLRFADGKTSKLVPRNTTGLAAFADLKFAGTGTIQVEWRVDGQPFRTDSQVLTFAQPITLSSGTLPGLPTATPGTHTVELRFLQPHTAFTLSPITYTVVVGRAADAGPVVETVTPGDLERGKEYELQLHGRNLTPGTSFAFGLGVGVVQPPQFQGGTEATLKVFISPSAKLGDRPVTAANPAGTHQGPGQITVGQAVQPKTAIQAPLVCPDLSTIPTPSRIDLKSPLFWFLPMPGTPQQQGDVITPAPPVGEKAIKLLTVDDGVTLVWDLPFAYYDYVEVRFFKPSGQQLLLTRQLPGAPESLRLSGDLMAELFEALKPSSVQTAQTGLALTGQAGAMELADLNLFGGGDKAEPSYDSLYADGLKAGADVAWQVAAFRVYPCLRDNKAPGGKIYTNQPVEEAVSELWLFNLPAAFTGLTCGGTGSQKAGNSIQAVNKTAGDRDQKAGPNSPTSNANFVGDLFELKGSFSLKESPYASHVAAGNSVKIENLFIDWGDGSSAVPVIGKLEGGGAWSKEKKITLIGGLWQSHRYQTEGNHTIRLFQLSEDDIQAPKTDFYAALGEAVTPPQPGNNPYLILLEAGQGQTPGGQEAEPNPLSGALPRAYMIFCSTILINHYTDKCATGPVHLVSLEILNFPGHDIVLPGKGSAQDGVMIRMDLAASYTGIHAVAVQCDQALIARARLRYFGAGSVEITWLVDGLPVQNKTYTLASKERANIAPGGKPDCSEAEVDNLVFTSQPFSVAILGKHNVRVRAEFTPQYGMADLAGSVNQAAADLLAIQNKAIEPPMKKDSSGPAIAEAAAVEGQGYDPFAAKLALEEKAGLTVPQIGLLSPNPESNGKPVVVYLNDALKGYDAPSSPGGPWANDSALGPGNRLTSDAKGYIVNEVRDVKFCRILLPTSGGEFTLSDLGSSIQLQGNVYNGKGTLIFYIRTAGAAVEKAFAPGTAFAGWAIEESSGRLMQGVLDASPLNGGTLAFPANISGLIKRLQGQVDGQALKPLMAVFDLELKGVHGTFLASAAGNAGQPPAWKSAAGALNTEGDWIASGLALGPSAIGLTGFRIESPAVTIDFSRQAAPPNASGEAAGPDWLGVYLDQAVITPATFGFAGTQSPAMTNLEPWRIKDGGLYGLVRSGSFSAKVDQTTVSFNHLDFKVAADNPEGKYILCAIHVPWIEAVLKGDAVLQLISDAEGYGTNWSGLTADPITVHYADKGRITMIVDGLVWGRDSRGWRARGHASVATEAEGKPFAAFHLNGLNFGTDGRAYFDGPTWDGHVGLSGNAAFGGATAALKGVQIQAAASGQDRLAFGVETEISISPDSSYIPASTVVIHYRIYDAGGGAFAGQGPWNAPFSSQVVFPLGSQEIDSAIAPSYDYDPNATDPEVDGLAGTAGPSPWAGLAGKAGKNMRFGGEIDLAMFGCESVKGAFVLGYQDGKSFFLLFAKYDNLVLPLSPVPLAIFGIGGGFAYNFSPEVFRHGGLAEAVPDMLGAASFCAELTLGTTDRYTIMSDGYMILGTDGSAEMGFKNAKLMQTGNFGGYIKYKNKSVTSKVWGELDLLGGLVNFSLGTEAAPAIDAYFGPGGWYVYAGRKAGPRIKATILKLGGVDSYLELDSQGLRMGGSQKFRLDVGPSLLKGYIESWMDIGLVINIDPFFIEGSWGQGVAAGACAFGVCLDFSISATISAHLPNPTYMRAKAELDFGILGTAQLEVGLQL